MCPTLFKMQELRRATPRSVFLRGVMESGGGEEPGRACKRPRMLLA